MPPSQATPLHIGSSIGLHPVTVLKRVITNSYTAPSSGSTNRGQKPRYSTPALDVLAAQAMPGVNIRIAAAAIEAHWLEPNLYGPVPSAPVVGRPGRLPPRPSRAP